MQVQLYQWHSENGQRRVIAMPGRRFWNIVDQDSGGLRVRKKKRHKEDPYMHPVDYPLDRAQEQFIGAALWFGATKSAWDLIGRLS